MGVGDGRLNACRWVDIALALFQLSCENRMGHGAYSSPETYCGHGISRLALFSWLENNGPGWAGWETVDGEAPRSKIEKNRDVIWGGRVINPTKYNIKCPVWINIQTKKSPPSPLFSSYLKKRVGGGERLINAQQALWKNMPLDWIIMLTTCIVIVGDSWYEASIYFIN